MKKDILKFIKHFLPLIIATGVALIFFLIAYFGRVGDIEEAQERYYDSPNNERVFGDRRVFDYADQLTDEEEAKLEAYISENEKKTLSDIVIVTLNESLADYEPEYRALYEVEITPDRYVMVYADKFWEDNRFGYDCPQVLDGTTDTGDGVLLVDNIFREPETDKVYTWMCTTGIAEETFSDDMINCTLDSFYYSVETDYYQACIDFVDKYVDYMDINPGETPSIAGHYLAYIIGLIILIAYYFTHLKSWDALGSTTETTYIVGDEPECIEREDILLRQEVSKRYNPPTSSSGGSSGGGGHHVSGGGGSHGGGGHSR